MEKNEDEQALKKRERLQQEREKVKKREKEERERERECSRNRKKKLSFLWDYTQFAINHTNFSFCAKSFYAKMLNFFSLFFV